MKSTTGKTGAKSATLKTLDYEQCLDAMEQFRKEFPQVVSDAAFLGVSLAQEEGGALLKVTIGQTGRAEFDKEVKMPKSFEARFGEQKAILKIAVITAPILTSVSLRSNGKKAPPTPPAPR